MKMKTTAFLACIALMTAVPAQAKNDGPYTVSFNNAPSCRACHFNSAEGAQGLANDYNQNNQLNCKNVSTYVWKCDTYKDKCELDFNASWY